MPLGVQKRLKQAMPVFLEERFHVSILRFMGLAVTEWGGFATITPSAN